MSTSNPAITEPALADATPQSASEQKAWSRLDAIFEYFERLGVASAVGAGGMAVIQFREKLMPGAGAIPATFGVLLFVAAFFLLVFATGASLRSIFGNVGKVALGVATAVSLTVGLLFVRAGFYVAAAALNPPAAPATPAAAGQPVQCETTTVLQGAVTPAKASATTAPAAQ